MLMAIPTFCIPLIVKSCLTPRGRVTRICVTKLGHHWFRWWCGACSAPPNFTETQIKIRYSFAAVHLKISVNGGHFLQTTICYLLCCFTKIVIVQRFGIIGVLDIITRNWNRRWWGTLQLSNETEVITLVLYSQAVRRLTVKSCEVSKPRDWVL